MDARILSELGMETHADNRALSNRNDIVFLLLIEGRAALGLFLAGDRGKDLDIVIQDLLDYRSANENGGKELVHRLSLVDRLVLAEEGKVNGSLEALELAAKVVAGDGDVEAADELLAADFGAVGLLCEQDKAGAGTPDWLSLDSFGTGQYGDDDVKT
jgi:hypothetical protein